MVYACTDAGEDGPLGVVPVGELGRKVLVCFRSYTIIIIMIYHLACAAL